MGFSKLTRRRLLQAAGGVTVTAGAGGLWFGIWKAGQRRWARPVNRAQAFAPSVYLAVAESSDITIWLTKTEMGQGVMTALPLLIAEELDADWSKVVVHLADLEADYDYGSMYTAASGSMSSLWIELRRAGAAARQMLVSAAASRFGVDEGACRVESGRIFGGSGHQASFGELAAKASTLRAPLRPRLKSSSEFRLIGQRLPRLDTRIKVTGVAKYGLDTHVGGAVWVAIQRCPVRGGSLLEVDDAPARNHTGVTNVITLERGVAVAADSAFAAQSGARQLRPTWRLPTDAPPSSPGLERSLREQLDGEGHLVQQHGTQPPTGGVERRSLTATYSVPLLAHAPMEPPNCTVAIRDGRCEIWAPTQHPQAARDVAIRISGISAEHTVVHRTLVGGGFGRRTATDDVAEAVQVAVAIGKPVHLLWSREDDIQHDFYREAAAHRLIGTYAADGCQLDLTHRLVTAIGVGDAGHPRSTDDIALMGAIDVPYTLERSRVEWRGVAYPVRVGIWRSVGYSHNTFALESFIDEVADSVGRDPVTLRLDLLEEQPRLRDCLRAVLAMAPWEEGAPSGTALGVAVSHCFGSYVAQIAQVCRAEGGGIQVLRVWCALDCGLAISPDTIEAQMEGGIAFGLSAALYGNISLRDGTVVQGNFDDYPILRQAQMPDVQVAIMPSAAPPSGVGELAVPPIAPAICNAWARLTGERLRDLPLAGGAMPTRTSATLDTQ
ncbi:MAG: molybdopterin cofactor-binding domain-containing protein [Nannocystaceae bacterium]